MARIKTFILATVMLTALFCVQAQNPRNNKIKTVNNKETPSLKFKPPPVHTYWGSRMDSASVTLTEVLNLLTLPIRISDDKKLTYNISTYHLLYRKRGVTEDEDLSGKITPVSSDVIELFRTTPLPELWIKNISSQIKTGEELYFFDIVVQDTQGHYFFAPTLRIRTN